MAKNRFTFVVEATAKGFGQVKKQLSSQLQGGVDESRQAVNKLNAKLNQLDADYKATQKTLSKVSAFKNLKKDTQQLGREWEKSQARIAELSRRIKTASGSTATLRREFNSQVKTAKKLKTQYNQNETALEEMRRGLKTAGVNTKDLGTEQTRLEKKLQSTQSEIKQTARAFKAAQRPTQTFFTRARTGVNAFNQRLSANTKNANAWAGKLRGAFATVAGAAGIGYLINRQLEMADATAKTADAIGISTDKLQEYRFVADRAGVDTQTLETGLTAFVKRLGELRAGQGALNTYLSKNNQTLKEQLIAAESTSEALDLYMEAMAGAGSSADRAAMSAQGFSRTAGVKMVNMVKGGTEAVKALKQEYQELGVTVEEDLLRQSENAIDKITNLKTVISSQLTRAITSLAPEIARVTEDLTNWIKAQDNLGERLKSGVTTLWEWVTALGSFIQKYGKFIAGFVATKIAIGYLRSLSVLIASINAGFTAMTGLGIVRWLGAYAKGTQIATIQTGILRTAVTSLGTALTLALGALTAFVGGWQLGKMIGEIDIVERAVQGMYATIDEWTTKAKIKYLELKRAWKDLWGDDEAVAQLDRQIAAQERHLDVIDRTREKIAAIDDSQEKSAEKAVESADKKIKAAMAEAQAEVEAEAAKRAANQETEDQEKDIYKAKTERIKGRTDDFQLALDEELAAIDLAEAKKQITEEQAQEKRIQAQREFIQEKLKLRKEALAESLESEEEETDKKLEFEKGLKTEIRKMEIELTRLKAKELSQQTEDVKEADQEQEKSAKQKYQERISAIRAETSAQRDELAKQIEYIDDLEEEGVISHQEAVDRKIKAEIDFAKAKVEQAGKAVAAAKEIHGEDSAEYQIAVNKEKQAAEDLADKKIESEERAQEARKALNKDFGAWLADFTEKIFTENSQTYAEYMEKVGALQDNLQRAMQLGGMVGEQYNELAAASQNVDKAFSDTAAAIQEAYGVAIDFSGMTWDEFQGAVGEVHDLFRDLMADMKTGQANIEATGQKIADWENNISDVDASIRDLNDQTSEFHAAWAGLWDGGPKTIDETRAAIDRVKSAYSEMVADGQAVISELMGQWDDLESKIQSVEEQIQGLYADTADTIRELNRDLMSDEKAWLDEREQAHEVYNQAIQAMNAGQAEQANELFNKARELAKGLAREVQDDAGEVVRTLDDTTAAAVALIEQNTQAQGGNLEALKNTLEGQQSDIRSQIGQTQTFLESTARKIGRINDQLRKSAAEIREIKNSLPSDWVGAGSPINKYAAGGPIGGRPHSQGGTIIEAEKGEWVQPVAAVKYYGQAFMEAIRRRLLPKFATGGPVSAVDVPRKPDIWDGRPLEQLLKLETWDFFPHYSGGGGPVEEDPPYMKAVEYIRKEARDILENEKLSKPYRDAVWGALNNLSENNDVKPRDYVAAINNIAAAFSSLSMDSKNFWNKGWLWEFRKDAMEAFDKKFFGESYGTGGSVSGPSHAAGGVPIEVEGGEYIEPRPAVKKYGTMIFEGLRQLKIDKSAVDWLLSGGRQVMGKGGIVHQSIQAAAPKIAMPRTQPRLVYAEGGAVPSASAGSQVEKVHRVRFDFGRGKSIEGDFTPAGAQALLREFEAAKLRSN